MQVLNKLSLITLLFLFLATISCKKDKKYVYQVADASVSKPIGDKSAVKTSTEFISIAYADLFGTTISNQKLQSLNYNYSAFADKKLMEDLVIRNFFNNQGLQIPSSSAMRSDTDSFVKTAYKKLLNREPDENELYQVKKIIDSNTSITAEVFYYSLLTSNEYRYY